MERYTIEDLMANLADDVNLPDIDRHRHRLKMHIRTVFSRIGMDIIGGKYIEEMEVRGHYLDLPNYVISMNDVGFTRDRAEGYEFTDDLNVHHPLTYTHTPDGVYFKNLQQRKIFVWFRGLKTDKRGYALVPEPAYEAVHQYCLAKLLDGMPGHPRFNDRGNILSQYEGLVALARIDLVGDSAARKRTERHYLGGGNPQILLPEEYLYRKQ